MNALESSHSPKLQAKFYPQHVNNSPHAQNEVRFSHYRTKYSKREETQRIHGIFKAKGKEKKWYEYDIEKNYSAN